MIRNLFAVFVSACLTVCYAQPVIRSGGVLHAGSYGSQIAQGSMFAIFGSGLGPAQLAQASAYPLSLTLAGTSVGVSINGQAYSAPVVYTSAGQVAAIMPSAVPTGNGTLTVAYNGTTSAPAQIAIVRSAFGAFSANAQGSGTAVIQNFVSATDQPRNSLETSARPGQVVTLWGTGLGPVSGPDDAAAPGAIVSDVQVLIGGKPARVLYSGRSGCCAGVDQIAFEIPADIQGCHVPIEVRVGSVSSTQNMTLAVGSSGALCTEPGLLTEADLDKARSQGGLKIGSLLMIRFALGDLQTFDYGFISFSEASYNQLVATSRNLVAAAPGTCEVYTYDPTSGPPSGTPGQLPPDFYLGYLFWGSGRPLEAGDRVTVAGNGTSMAFNKMVPGLYSNYGFDPSNPTSLGGFLSPGNYTIENGSGGPSVPAFRTNVAVPQTARFTTSAQVSIDRSRDYTVRWTGGSAEERVFITGSSYSFNPLAVGTFTCIARGNSNSFTIPSSVLSRLPRADNVATGFTYLGLYSFTSFQRSNVPGLDAFYAGVMNYSYQLAQLQ